MSNRCSPSAYAQLPSSSTEAWEWTVRPYLRWHLIEHYLDDMMAVFPASQGKQLTQFKRGYPELCDITGILRNDDKDAEGTTIKFLGRIVDSTTFTVYIPQDKVDRVISLTADALVSNSMTIHEAQQLAGLLSFCASAVQLGFVFCRRIWSFVASFRSEWNKEFKRRIPAQRPSARTFNGGMTSSPLSMACGSSTTAIVKSYTYSRMRPLKEWGHSTSTT